MKDKTLDGIKEVMCTECPDGGHCDQDKGDIQECISAM